jgi:hypothetical protein
MRLHRLVLGFLAASFSALAFTACGAGSSESCDSLQRAAATELESTQKGFLACQVDADCVVTLVSSKGTCAAACGGLTGKASAASFINYAANLCEDYDARGCVMLNAGCPWGGPFLCAGGTCTFYHVTLTPPSPPVTHGVCAAFEVNYATPSGPADAPHDVSVAVSAAGATLYADVACTTPLAAGTVTIPGGAPGVAFGFEALAAGPFSISAAPSAVGSYVAE